MKKMAYVAISEDGRVRLHPQIGSAEHELFVPNSVGGAAFRARVAELGLTSVMCSSTIDFPEEWGVSRQVLADHFGLGEPTGGMVTKMEDK